MDTKENRIRKEKRSAHVMIIINILTGIGLLVCSHYGSPECKNYIILPVLAIIMYIYRLYSLDKITL